MTVTSNYRYLNFHLTRHYIQSAHVPRNIEGEFVYFSSTPLFDSSNHEDTDEIIDFSDHSCHDLFAPVFDHDDDSIADYFSNLFMMIYLLMKLKPPKLSRHFSPS